MSFIVEIQRRIRELESQIQNNNGEVDELKKILSNLQRMEFEEDLREQGDKQLLQEVVVNKQQTI